MTHQNDLLDQKNGKNKQIDLEIEFDHFIDIIKNFMAIRLNQIGISLNGKLVQEKEQLLEHQLK